MHPSSTSPFGASLQLRRVLAGPILVLILLAVHAVATTTRAIALGPAVVVTWDAGIPTVSVSAATAGTDKVKWYDVTTTATRYLGSAATAPWALRLTDTVTRSVEARLYTGRNELARIRGTLGATTPPSTTPPPASPTPTASATSTPTPSTPPASTPPASTPPASTPPASTPPASTPPPPAGTVNVSNVAQLNAALTGARAGTVIVLADGTYMNNGGDRFVLAANGTAAAPITLRGGRSAVLSSDSPTGDYGLHITGDYWRVEGLTVRNATKGVVLDGSIGTVLDGIEVGQVGDEGVHFRACSSDGVLRNSYIHETGLSSPQYGEGVYVGSANSNWSKYSCTDGKDNSERVLVENNVFRTITAEGADLKEGTESGILRGNVFDNTGFSGQNSADSAVDAKGNNWLIENNIVRNPTGADLDGFQTHSVYSGYGTGNVFRRNRVEGAWRGFGVGLNPALGNVVACDNAAPGAASGLVGAAGKQVSCNG